MGGVFWRYVAILLFHIFWFCSQTLIAIIRHHVIEPFICVQKMLMICVLQMYLPPPLTRNDWMSRVPNAVGVMDGLCAAYEDKTNGMNTCANMQKDKRCHLFEDMSLYKGIANVLDFVGHNADSIAREHARLKLCECSCCSDIVDVCTPILEMCKTYYSEVDTKMSLLQTSTMAGLCTKNVTAFLDATVEESNAAQCGMNVITLRFKPNYNLKELKVITVTGLNGHLPDFGLRVVGDGVTLQVAEDRDLLPAQCSEWCSRQGLCPSDSSAVDGGCSGYIKINGKEKGKEEGKDAIGSFSSERCMRWCEKDTVLRIVLDAPVDNETEFSISFNFRNPTYEQTPPVVMVSATGPGVLAHMAAAQPRCITSAVLCAANSPQFKTFIASEFEDFSKFFDETDGVWRDNGPGMLNILNVTIEPSIVVLPGACITLTGLIRGREDNIDSTSSLPPPFVRALAGFFNALAVESWDVAQRDTCLSEPSRCCHAICWRMVLMMAVLILLGMIRSRYCWIILCSRFAKLVSTSRTIEHGIQHNFHSFSHSTIPRRIKLTWVLMLIILMQSSQVDGASFTTKAIVQRTPIPAATNRITAPISDADLRETSGSIVTISGLSDAIVSSPISLLDVGDNGQIIFSDGTTGVETRYMTFPAIIDGSIAPTEGPISKGSLVLLGILGADVLLNPDLKSSLKFRVQDVDNKDNFAYGTIVAEPLSLADWKTAESPEYISFIRNTANFSQGSSKLVKDYQNVFQSAKSFADDSGGGVVVLLAVRTPNWTGAGMVQAVVEYDGYELEFGFEYWEAEPNPQVESVRAQNGRASGIITGGYPLSISISGFSITYDMDDISIVFGSGPGQVAQVLLLERSDSNGTTVYALAPPGNPGVVQVMVSNNAQGSSVLFEFEYLNDSIPEVESIAPLLHAGGLIKVSAVGPFKPSTTLKQFRRSQIKTFGGCTFSLDAASQLSSTGSCDTSGGTLDLAYRNIVSLAQNVFANMPNLQ